MLNTEIDAFKIDTVDAFLEQNRIETSLNLSDEHFDKILSITGAVSNGFCEVGQNEVRYGGRITFNVIYLNSGFERLEVGAEFSFKKQGDFNCDTAKVNFAVGDITLKKNNGMIYAETVLSAKILGNICQEVNFLVSLDALKKQSQIESYETRSGSLFIDVDNEFECDKLKNILYSSASAVINRTECGYGNVLVEGEVFISLSLLPFLPNSDIVNKRVAIPFGFEVEVPQTSPDSVAFASALVEKLSLKVYTQVDGEKSSVTCQASLKIMAESQSKVQKTMLVDAFSPSNELEIIRGKKCAKMLLGAFSKTEKLSGKFICQIPENSRFITATGETIELCDSQKINDTLKIDGLVHADMIFVDGEGEIVSKKADLSISTEFDGIMEEISDLSIFITNFSVKYKNGQLEAEISVKICGKKQKNYFVEYIEEINVGQEKPLNNATISVYLAQKGDDEWAIEKEFGASIDEIYALNENLEFPLSGGEKIIYYRQK